MNVSKQIRFIYTLLVAGSLFTTLSPVHGQDLLDRPVPTLAMYNHRLEDALKAVSAAGNFYFSYSSDLFNKDSLVTLKMERKTVRQVLDTLFRGRLEYKVNGNYIILRKAPPPPVSSPPMALEDKKIVVRGVILDENTGEAVSQASVYDKQGLIATLTDEGGFFTIRLKNRSSPAALTVSKEFYEDTTIKLQPGVNQKITISVVPISANRKMVTIGPEGYLPSDSIRVELDGAPVYLRQDPIRVEMSGLGKLLLSSKMKIQSINLRKYFIQQPFQLSLFPGIGTQGILSPQITNKISLNIIGGYTAGLDGVELGGVINIDKKKVEGFQAVGIANVVGGPLKGVQLAGSHNIVLDSVRGFQAAGVGNFNKGKLKGVQLAGVMNKVSDSVEGMQAAGIINITKKETKGLQLAGIVNITHKLKGVQIGLVNIADTSEGYGIGLINIVKKGMHEISLFANEVSPLNIAYRSGNDKLYTILLAGYNPGNDRRSYLFGFGLGHRFHLGKTLSLDPELSSEQLVANEWSNYKYSNFINKFSLDLHVRLGKYFSLSGGPSLAIYSFDRKIIVNGHDFSPVAGNYGSWRISDKVTGWIGWRAGINFL
ncbi:MAG TPA: STN and carboxypeptidase regulatory-like domain-containing protein [Puia sp.]|nr:STN and carboxypeptidase regulatory-like domain-containing protein [Puia sp.]